MRLACVRHAASVHSEPGSNSPMNKSPCRQGVSSKELGPIQRVRRYLVFKDQGAPASGAGNSKSYVTSASSVKAFFLLPASCCHSRVTSNSISFLCLLSRLFFCSCRPPPSSQPGEIHCLVGSVASHPLQTKAVFNLCAPPCQGVFFKPLKTVPGLAHSLDEPRSGEKQNRLS